MELVLPRDKPKLPSASELEIIAKQIGLKASLVEECLVYRFDKSGKQRRKHVVIVITVDAKGRGCWTIQVLPPPSISLFESTSAVPVGHEVILTASATSQGAPVSRVSISFYCNGSYVGSTTTNSSGVATLVYIPKSVGAVSIMALLSSYPSVSASGKLTVIPATAFRIQISAKAPSIIMVGQAVTLTAVAKFTNGTPVKGADVSFSVNGTIVGIETTDVRGVANLPYVFSKRGIASITASVDGVNSSTSTSVQQANRKQALLHLVVYAG
ncbi:MAG: hypothetical protein ACP5SK_00455, partial [Thermoprotei archaeon]